MVALGLGIANIANAQISTGETSSKVIRTGNRAQQGNFGIYLGATSDMFKSIGHSGDDFRMEALPLINLKYMYTDNIEFRLGLEWYDKYESATTDYPTYNEAGEESGSENYTTSESESKFMFYPGVAYHFSNNNLLDVYVGADLPFGWGTLGNHTNYSDKNIDNEGATASVFRIGVGAFIGLQAYIANLPLAIGVEYGISTLYNHYSNCTYDKQGYEIAVGQGENKYEFVNEDFSANKWKLGNQFRVTLSYYFNR